MRHVANAMPRVLEDQQSSWLEVAAQLGTVGAAIFAAIAAGLSWLVAKRNWQSAYEAGKLSLIKSANEAVIRIQLKSMQADQMQTELILEGSPSHTAEIKDDWMRIIRDLVQARDGYRALAKKIHDIAENGPYANSQELQESETLLDKLRFEESGFDVEVNAGKFRSSVHRRMATSHAPFQTAASPAPPSKRRAAISTGDDAQS